jgi:hypothetical protein
VRYSRLTRLPPLGSIHRQALAGQEPALARGGYPAGRSLATAAAAAATTRRTAAGRLVKQAAAMVKMKATEGMQ